jgi:very-short-patch-repair endonuclease
MTWDVEAVVGSQGWATWTQLRARIGRSTISAWVADGRLVRLQPEVYATVTAARRWQTRVEAALVGREGVISHGSALALWELMPVPAGPVHVTVDARRSGRGSAGVVLHRDRDVDRTRRRAQGLPVTSVERAVVDSWDETRSGVARHLVRAAAITAVRRRVCSAAGLMTELDHHPRLRGRAELAGLVRLLAEGCQSELEIWGCLQVLRGPGMPRFTQQRPVYVSGRRFLLDAACEEVLLAVEMDGAAWHGAREQRERDLRRDALLASIGWQTLRYSYRRLTQAPEDCRREIRATWAARLALSSDAVR